MDNKTWLWRKKSSEKTIIATNKFGTSVKVKGMGEELPMGNEVGAVRPVRNLSEKLASVLLDPHAKDDLVLKHDNLAKEAGAGQEKAEVQLVSMKKELDEVIKQRDAANEKLTVSDAALKQSMQQLRSLQEGQEQKIHDAVMMALSDSEKAQKQLEESLKDTSKGLADFAIENTNLCKALVLKEKLVEELHKHASQTAAEFNALMARLDSTEKENAFLKYEFHMLEKELEVRSEELEYTRRSADASCRQHLESIKKITKLEGECQRLRILVRKKLPGPAALAKMRNEVEMLGRDSIEVRRKPNPTRDLVFRETSLEKSPEIPVHNINFLIEQLRRTEEENKTLKDILTKKNAELRSSRIMTSRAASRLSQAESQLIEISRGQKSMDLVKCTSPLSHELCPVAGFDAGSEDSSSGSWPNALISELAHFRDAKLRTPPEYRSMEVSDISLMDDFLEMEKLAIVSAQASSGGCNDLLSAGKELVPVVQGNFSCNDKQEIHSKDAVTDYSFDWLQEVLSAIFKQQRISKRSITELLEDIKIALGYINHRMESNTTAISRHWMESDIRSCVTWKSPDALAIIESMNKASSVDAITQETSKQHKQSNLSKSICKIIQLIEGINPMNVSKDNVSKGRETLSPSAGRADYFVHVFQWRSCELSNILERFLHTCNATLSKKAGLESFAEEVSCTLDWILNNCVTTKDSSSTRDKIKRHFSRNELQSESEAVGAEDHSPVETDAICVSEEKPSCFPLDSSSNGQKKCDLQNESKRLKDELKDMKARVQAATNEIEALTVQLQESERSIKSLQLEVETIKESKRMVEDQIENQKLINEDLDTQLTVAKAKLSEVLQKFSSLEVELEEKCNCCEELEATCLELQLQLESVAKKDSLNYNINEEAAQHQSGSEITAASLKLAECQETILNLGKQLKALSTPREAALFDKVFNTTNTTSTAVMNRHLNRRFSLRDQMQAEDTAKGIFLKSPTRDSRNLSNDANALTIPNVQEYTPQAKADYKHKAGNASVGPLAIVPAKKKGGAGLLRRLLMRRKKGSIKKSYPNT